MDSIYQLLHLRQGGPSIEEYVHQFCELSYQVPLYDKFLFKDLFHFGLNGHIKSQLNKSLFPGGEFNGSLRGLLDYALLYAGSSFTVGVAEKECDTALLTKMADAPESTHKMAEATTHHQKPGSAHVMPTEPGSAHVMPAEPGSAHVVPAKPGSALVVPAKPGSVLVVPAMPESPAKMATMPADAPLWPGLIASVLDPPLVSVRAAGIPRSAESAPEAAPSQELAESAPEPLLVPSGSPEPLLAPFGSPSSPLVLPSSPSPLVPSSLALPERPRDSAPPEHPLEVVVFPKEIVLGGPPAY